MELKMSKLSEKLKSLKLAEDAPVKLRYSGTTQVNHYTGDYIYEALEDTGVLDQLAYAVSYEDVRKYNSVLNTMRRFGMLDDYERGSFNFYAYVKDIISDNWNDFIDERLEQWDSKRGMCKMSAEFEVPLNLLIEAEENGFCLSENWLALVQTEDGIMEVEYV